MSDENLEELASAFERDGFVNGGRVLEATEIAALAEAMKLHVEAWFLGKDLDLPRPVYGADIGKKAGHNHYQLAGMWKASEPFRRLIENPRLVQIAARLANAKTLQVWADTVQYKPPLQGAHFQWHQDAPYHDSLDPAQRLIGAWVALDDADLESGCMWMVPGSHRWGVQEQHLWSYHQVDELEAFGKIALPKELSEKIGEWRDAVPRPVRAGEVHFHHALMWHGSPANRSNRLRRAYTIHYMPDGTRRSPKDDRRISIPVGADMIDAGPDFPIVYRAPG